MYFGAGFLVGFDFGLGEGGSGLWCVFVVGFQVFVECDGCVVCVWWYGFSEVGCLLKGA